LNARRWFRRLVPVHGVDEGQRSIEERLVVAAKAGDAASFEALVRRHIDRMYGVARLMLRDPDLADDAVQGAFVRAWRDIGALREPGRFEPWLHTLVVRACYDEVRRSRRWGANVRVLAPVVEPSSHDETPEDRDVIERGFRLLSPEHRMVLVLHFYLDLSAGEIGARLGVPPGTARSRLHYALAALRSAIEADERGAAPGARGTA
jgi:RNA polymerase sigma-70 factor (ECF subfamily)